MYVPYKFYVLGQIHVGLSKQCRPKIRLLLKKLFAIPSASFGCINAMLHQTFLFLGQWQLFEVSQILEFLRYVGKLCGFNVIIQSFGMNTY